MRLSRALAVMGALALLLTLPNAASATTGNYTKYHLKQLNDSGAEGWAKIGTNHNGDLHVMVKAWGLVPNSPHAQHLHGSTEAGHFLCPDESADTDGDGIISTIEGIPDYGNINISLTTEGDTSPDSGLALDRFPAADEHGNLWYGRWIPADMLPDGTVGALDRLHVVQHGVDANDNDTYDLDGLGESPLAKSLGLEGVPFEATAPATCGESVDHDDHHDDKGDH